jgi:hypothetical protein
MTQNPPAKGSSLRKNICTKGERHAASRRRLLKSNLAHSYKRRCQLPSFRIPPPATLTESLPRFPISSFSSLLQRTTTGHTSSYLQSGLILGSRVNKDKFQARVRPSAERRAGKGQATTPLEKGGLGGEPPGSERPIRVSTTTCSIARATSRADARPTLTTVGGSSAACCVSSQQRSFPALSLQAPGRPFRS